MRKLVLPLLVTLGFALLGSSCDGVGKKKGVPSPSDKVFTVGLAKVQTREIPDVIEIKGVFTPIQRMQVKSEFSGRVQTLSVIEGQSIVTGDALLKIEDEKLPLLLDRQRAELREAEAQQELDTRLASAGAAPGEDGDEEENNVEESPGETPAPRTPGVVEPEEPPVPQLPEAAVPLPLAPQDAGGTAPEYGAEREMVTGEEDLVGEERRSMAGIRSRMRANRTLARRTAAARPTAPLENPEVTESRLSLDQARVDRLKADIAITERQLAGSTLSSPNDGFVNKVAITEGGLVKPDDLLVEIVQVDPIELVLKMPKDQIDKLEKSLEVKVNVPDLPGQSFKGEISFIGAELDADKKSVEVRVRVANPNLKIKVGMEGIAEIAVAQKTHQALLIPPDAVLQQGEKKYVYVLDGNLAEKQEINTGTFYEGLIEVKSGLKASDQIVTRGVTALKEDEEYVKVSQ